MIQSHFNKCITIGNDLVTADDNMIILWSKTNKNSTIYKNVKSQIINEKTSDLLLANNQYFISSQPNYNKITLFDIKKIKPEKYIKNIDCIDSTNCFLLFNQYIIINCKKGIALFLIKTKEICQYVENFNGIYDIKEIFLDNKVNICILNKFNYSYLKLIKLRMIDGYLEPFEIYENIKANENDLKIMCMNDGDYILWRYNFYILKDIENNNF